MAHLHGHGELLVVMKPIGESHIRYYFTSTGMVLFSTGPRGGRLKIHRLLTNRVKDTKQVNEKWVSHVTRFCDLMSDQKQAEFVK